MIFNTFLELVMILVYGAICMFYKTDSKSHPVHQPTPDPDPPIELLKRCFRIELCVGCHQYIASDESAKSWVEHLSGAPISQELLADVAARCESRMSPPPGFRFRHYHSECYNREAHMTKKETPDEQ